MIVQTKQQTKKKTGIKASQKKKRKKGKTAGAFGNKRKKAPIQPKFVGKRGPRVARDEDSAQGNSAFGNTKKPSPKKSGGRGR